METKLQKYTLKKKIRHALHLLMDEKDYDEITVKDICDRANISRMSFYRHFDKKDDIFSDFTDERFEDFYEGITQTTFKDNIQIMDYLLDYFIKYKSQTLLLIKAKKEMLLLESFQNYSQFLFPKIREIKGYEKVDLSFILFVAGGLHSLIVNWFKKDPNLNKEEIKKILLNTLSKVRE